MGQLTSQFVRELASVSRRQSYDEESVRRLWGQATSQFVSQLASVSQYQSDGFTSQSESSQSDDYQSVSRCQSDGSPVNRQRVIL